MLIATGIRRWRMVAFAIALLAASACGGGSDSGANQQISATSTGTTAPQHSTAKPKQVEGFPYDWSHHHVIFSHPRSAAMAKRLAQEPRYRIQQAWRARQANTASADAYMHGLDALAVQLAASPSVPVLPHIKWGKLAPSKRLRGDWSVNLGSNAKVGAGRYPAKFSFNPIGAPDCTNDFVVFNTGLTGSSSPGQASVIAFNKLYAGASACGTSGVPAVYWSYNTGGKVINSVVLSGDGTQIAFIHSPASGAASLVVLKWKGGQGTGAGAPVTPNTNTTDPGTFVTCKSNAANSCELTLNFGNLNNNTHSSPFYDYQNDIIYVGDDGGSMHKFTGVFKGTPGEASSPWPVSLHNGVFLDSPVLDSGVTTPMIYVTESSDSSLTGTLDSINTSSGATVRSPLLGHNTIDFADGPIVDSSAGKIYVAIGNDNAGNSGVFVFTRGFTSTTSGTEAKVGAASTTTPLPIYDGDFDNVYYNSSNGTGNLYICGNTGGNPTLYQVPVTTTAFGTVHTGPSLAGSNTTCSPVTEIYNSSAAGGPFDWIFLSVQAGGSLSNCSSGGCVVNFIVTQWQANNPYSSNQEVLDTNLNIQKVTTAGTSGASAPAWNATLGLTTSDGGVTWTNQGSMGANGNASSAAEASGTSGIIIDNTSSATGASQIYFSTLGTGTCGAGCAVQASQSGLK